MLELSGGKQPMGIDLQMVPDSSTIKLALKTLCRENGVERDRRAVAEIAILLTSLWQQGTHDGQELLRLAREKLAEAAAKPNGGSYDARQ